MKVLGRYIFERRPKFLTEDLVISSELQSVVDSLNDLDSAKQDLLVSGLNIKTINGQSILGAGDISIVGSLFKFSATNYSALLLVTGAVAGDLAYVYNSQGTLILPGNWGGTYYDKGAYVFDGVNWIDDNDLTNKTLQESIDSLNLLATDVALLYTNKVDKVIGKQLSTEDYTTAEKNKLAGISGTNTGDETTTSIQTKRPLKTIEGQSLEGSGNIDLSKSDVGLSNVQNVDTTITTNITDTSLKRFVTDAEKTTWNNKQDALTLKTIEGQSIVGVGNIDLNKSDVGLSNVDNTSDLNKPISTATQTALDGKAALSHSHAISDVTGLQTVLNGKQSLNTLGSKSLDVIATSPSATQDGFVYFYNNQTDKVELKSITSEILNQPSSLIDTNSALNTLTNTSFERQIYTGTTWGKQTSLGNATSYANNGRLFRFINTTRESVSILYNDLTEVFRLEPYCTCDAFLIDKTTTNGIWYFTVEYPDWVIKSEDDYIASTTTGSSNNTVTVTGTAAAVTQFAGVAGSQGVLQLDCGTTATGVAALSNTATLLNLGVANGAVIIERRVQVPVLSSGGQSFTSLIGLGDTTATGDHVDGIYFIHDQASLNWQFRARSNSVSTATTTTTVPIVAGQWYKLKIELNYDNTNAWFYVDDVPVGSISSGLPNLAGRQLSPNIKIYKTAGTQARTILEDYRKFRNYLKR